MLALGPPRHVRWQPDRDWLCASLVILTSCRRATGFPLW